MESFIHAHFWEMILRTTLSFLHYLFWHVYLEKQLGQLTFFHYITGITFGSIASEIASQEETPFLDGMISLVWWSALTYLMTVITIKSKKLAFSLMISQRLLFKRSYIRISTTKNRLHLDELTMMLREQAIFSVQDVEYALLETNGKLSVLQKPLNRWLQSRTLKQMYHRLLIFLQKSFLMVNLL